MNTANPTEVKKGNIIFVVTSWNHHYNTKRGKHGEYIDGKFTGEWIEHTKDVYNIQTWTVHSIGKKVMRVMDSEGNLKKSAHYIREGKFWSKVFTNKQDAVEAIQELHETDQFATPEYDIIEEQTFGF